MSILINLLPDLRQAKIRDHRRRQLVSGVSIMIWVVCGSVVALMAAYEVGQKAIIAGYTRSIADKKQQLESVTGLVDALTAQQHGASLASLYSQRVYMTKFFAAYGEINPTDVTLTSLALDNQNALVVNGVGKTYASVSKLARTLEAAHVKVGTGAAESNSPYFSNVTISSVSNSGKGVTFTLNAALASGVTSGSN